MTTETHRLEDQLRRALEGEVGAVISRTISIRHRSQFIPRRLTFRH